MVDKFYKGLDEESCRWLEENDPQYNRPRGIMIKEKATQMVQIEEAPISKRQRWGKRP